MLNSAEHEVLTVNKYQIESPRYLINPANVKMPTIVGILTFIVGILTFMPTIVGILTFVSRINLVLSRVEHEKSFITLGPGIKLTTPMTRQVAFPVYHRDFYSVLKKMVDRQRADKTDTR